MVSATAVIHDLQALGQTEEDQFTRHATNPDLFELLVGVDPTADEGLKTVTISAWDWIANLSMVTVNGFIVDRTPPRMLDVTLDASGTNLYIPTANPDTVYHGPQTQNATLTVLVDVDDTHPIDPIIVVSGVDLMTFPAIFVAGDGGSPAQNGTVHPAAFLTLVQHK